MTTEYDEVDETEIMALHEAAHLTVAVMHDVTAVASLKGEVFESVDGTMMRSGGRTSFLGTMYPDELAEVLIAGFVMETEFVAQTFEDAMDGASEDFKMIKEIEDEADLTVGERQGFELTIAKKVRATLDAEFITVRRIAKSLMIEDEVKITPQSFRMI